MALCLRRSLQHSILFAGMSGIRLPFFLRECTGKKAWMFFLFHKVWMLGVLGWFKIGTMMGKTPLAYAAYMAMSNKLIKMNALVAEPCFKVGSHLDFFRGDPARLHVPHRSCPFSTMQTCMLKVWPVWSKACVDVSAEYAKVMVRYTTSSFCKHQPRFLCTNTFNVKEPDLFIDPTNTNDVTIDRDAFIFMHMLRVAFNSQACDEDVAGQSRHHLRILHGQTPSFRNASRTRRSLDSSPLWLRSALWQATPI